MPRLSQVPQGKIALAASWFRSVRDRIEEIVPLAGDGIKVEQSSSGIIISLDLNENGQAGGIQSYTLNICKDGQPDTLEVYGPEEQ